MSAKSPTGGANRTVAWLYDAGGAVAFSTLDEDYMLFDKSETSTITGDVRVDQLELELASKIRNANFIAFKEKVLTRVNVATNIQSYEDGTEDTAMNIPSGAQKLCIIHVDGEIGGERVMTSFVGLLASDGIGSARSSGSFGDTNVKFSAIPAPTTTTISATLANAALSDVIATITDVVISADAYGKEEVVTAA